MKHLMKMYEKKIFELIEDDVLDKMLDNDIAFDKLSDEDKYVGV